MNEQNAVLMAYYRNNVIHVFALPSLIEGLPLSLAEAMACARAARSPSTWLW